MKNSFLLQVFASLILAVIAGYLTGPTMEIGGITMVRIYGLIGQLFLNALTLVVVPLVASSIITGTARIGSEQGFGILGRRTFGYFILTGAIAVLIGMAVASAINPGKYLANIKLPTDASLLKDIPVAAAGGTFEKIEGILYRLIPSNILAVASQGQMLGLIFFSILFGFYSTRIEPDLSKQMTKLWKGLFEIMMKMTHLIMRALPIGVFGLMAKAVATTGFDTIKPVMIYFVTVLSGLALFMFIVLPLMIRVIAKRNPFTHFRAMSPALFTAFSTSSTAATLPMTLDCMETRAKVPNRICSFTLPLGTTLNLAGTALFVTVAVMFIAQANNLALNPGTLFTIGLMGLFTSFGMVAGVPSGGLVTILVILHSLGLPAEGLILILPVERILDMCRTPVTVFCNSCCTLLVAKE